ncbi:hypothetical protein FSP39_002149 [Pinctada imbricata]|uniref:Uncharacterized protein n=1 Tax=Pinctada imbricata TaxID=66713 RepID=A0AA89BS90_PINIB|nr:hypothetical protein FSP39_002149 [Pinctada imbricata]
MLWILVNIKKLSIHYVTGQWAQLPGTGSVAYKPWDNEASGEMKKLKAELDAKIKMEETVNQSFEAKVKPFLINSNQGKYLFDGYKERSRLILADTAILRKHYKGIIPTNTDNESNKWQEIIKIFEERHVPKQKVSNPVRQLLEANPVHNVQFPQIPNIPRPHFLCLDYPHISTFGPILPWLNHLLSRAEQPPQL